MFTRLNNDRDASLWWKSSVLCGVACTGAGLAGVPMLPGILASVGSATLATWVDKHFNQGRISTQVSCMQDPLYPRTLDNHLYCYSCV